MRHFDSCESFRERADLIHLDENRICDPIPDALRQACDICDEEIVADQLTFTADQFGERLPTLPIVLGHAVLDRNYRVARGKIAEILRLLQLRTLFSLAVVGIDTVFEEFRR